MPVEHRLARARSDLAVAQEGLALAQRNLAAAQDARPAARERATTLANEELADAEKWLEKAREVEAKEVQETPITVYRFHSMGHWIEFSEEDYTKYSNTQMSIPVCVTTVGLRRWWWYLDRFWWDSEGLDDAEVQARVARSETRKRATLERPR